MRKDWTMLAVDARASLRDTMAVIDKALMGFGLVVNEAGILLGTVTDGDIRRGILRGVDLDDAVGNIMNRNFVFVGRGASEAEILRLLQRQEVRQVPVVETGGKMVGYYVLPDLLEHSTLPNWVVIMAGGEGRRLRPLTDNIPKPMLPVAGRPLLENIVSLLVSQGFREVFISIRYLGSQIEQHFGNGEEFGCNIRYLREDKPLGTVGALSLLPEMPSEPLLMLNGDLLTTLNLPSLIDFHIKTSGIATQCVREYVHQVPFGVVHCENGEVREMEEKPIQRLLINAGIYVMSPELIDAIPRDEPCDMPDLLSEMIKKGNKVSAFPIHEQWIDIGKPDDYERASQEWPDEVIE